MGQRIRKQVAEALDKKKIRDFVTGKVVEMQQMVKDYGLYAQGALEQLMFQQGQMMTVQAAILEWLDKTYGTPSMKPSDQVNSIVQEAIARHKARREAEEAEAKRIADEKEAAAAIAPLTLVPEEIPADIAPELPADAAPADSPGSS